MIFMGSASIQAQTIWDGTTDTRLVGEGTKENPYTIGTAEQLAGLAKRVNAGNTYKGIYFELTSDIILNDTTRWDKWDSKAPQNSWTPIGYNNENLFEGFFNGKGHTISGMYVNQPDSNNVGLFGRLGGYISHLNLAAFYASGKNYVGGLAGYSTKLIDNCHVRGNVAGVDYVGCFIGDMGSYADTCSAQGTVSGAKFVGVFCGDGLVAFNCSAVGNAVGTEYVGGLMGNGYAQNSCARSEVIGKMSVGGLIGYADFNVVNCYAIGEVTGDTQVGGLVGRASYNIIDCYANCKVTGVGGGLIGHLQTDRTVTNSYYDQKISNQNDTDKGTPLTTSQLKNKGSFVDWDFHRIWGRRDDINNGYPYLLWTRSERLKDTWDFGAIPWDGKGTETNPYLISSAADLQKLSAAVAANENMEDTYFLMTDNIWLNDTTDHASWDDFTEGLTLWTPIGTLKSPFLGHFDGDGHVIGGLLTQSFKKDFAGLFGSIAGEATVQKVGVTASCFYGNKHVGGFVGLMLDSTKISNCYTHARTFANDYIGGFIGSIDHYYEESTRTDYWGVSYIYDSYATGKITLQSSSVSSSCGGFLGYSKSYYGYADWYYLGSSTYSCYFDEETVGLTTSPRGGDACSPHEMRQKGTYYGWDFENLWGRRNDTNGGYPYFRNSIAENLPDDTDYTRITIEINAEDAVLSWPIIQNAKSYELTIWTDPQYEEWFSKTTFDEWGNVTSDNRYEKPAYSYQTDADSITYIMNNLTPSTTYYYRLACYDDNNYRMEERYFGEFTTQEDTSIENIIESTLSGTHKVFNQGTIYIIRNNERYTIDGRRVL